MRLLLLLLAWPVVAAWNLLDWWINDVEFEDKVMMVGALLVVLVLMI